MLAQEYALEIQHPARGERFLQESVWITGDRERSELECNGPVIREGARLLVLHHPFPLRVFGVAHCPDLWIPEFAFRESEGSTTKPAVASARSVESDITRLSTSCSLRNFRKAACQRAAVGESCRNSWLASGEVGLKWTTQSALRRFWRRPLRMRVTLSAHRECRRGQRLAAHAGCAASTRSGLRRRRAFSTIPT